MPRYGRGRNTAESSKRSLNGYEQWGGYIESRKRKHEEQFPSNKQSDKTKLIFSGVTIYINGYTDPSSDKLRDIVISRGGNYEHWLVRRRVTHVIASNLNHTKINNIRSLKVVSPSWITDSVKEGRLLSHVPYLLYKSTALSLPWASTSHENLQTSEHVQPSEVAPKCESKIFENSNDTNIDFGESSRETETAIDSDDSDGDDVGDFMKLLDDSEPAEYLAVRREQTDAHHVGANCASNDWDSEVGNNTHIEHGELTEMHADNEEHVPNSVLRETESIDLNVSKNMLSSESVNSNFKNCISGNNSSILSTNEFTDTLCVDEEICFSSDEEDIAGCRLDNHIDKPIKKQKNDHLSIKPDDNKIYCVRNSINMSDTFDEMTKNSRDNMNNTLKIDHSTSATCLSVNRSNCDNTITDNLIDDRYESPHTSTTNSVSKFNDMTTSVPNTSNPNFIADFYSQSRLHHISTWKTEFTTFVKKLQQQSDGNFVGRKKLDSLSVVNPDDPLPCVGERVIMHIDMDCFFVSAGIRDKPELIGKPVAVTHSRGRGPNRSGTSTDIKYEAQQIGHSSSVDVTSSLAEIASCSYEARQAGLRNGMMMGEAKKLCPHLVTIPYDFDLYRSISLSLYNIVASYTHDIEAGSCDEMLVDITDLLTNQQLSPLTFVSHLRSEIFTATRCPASAGIGPNILLAKLATRKAKPNGQFRVQSADVNKFMLDIPLKSLPGVGRAMLAKLKSLPAESCKDLLDFPLSQLQSLLGQKHGETLYNQCRGEDTRQIVRDQVRKSVSAEINYGIRFKQMSDAHKFMTDLCLEVSKRLNTAKVKGRQITLKIMVRREDAPQEAAKFMGHGLCNNMSRSATLPTAIDDPLALCNECMHLLRQLGQPVTDLRGVGIHVGKLETELSSRHAVKSRSQSILNFVSKPPQTLPTCVLDTKPEKLSASEHFARNTNIEASRNFSVQTSHSTQPHLPQITVPLPANVLGLPPHTPFSVSTPTDSHSTTADTSAPTQLKVDVSESINAPEMSAPSISQSQDCVLLSPSQVDESVLKELPENIRAEIEASLKLRNPGKSRAMCKDEKNPSPSKARTLKEMLQKQTIKTEKPVAANVTALPSPSQIDKECFDALPIELQQELKQEYLRQNRLTLNSPSKKSSGPHSTTSPRTKKSPVFKVPASDAITRRHKRSPKKLNFKSKQPTLKSIVDRNATKDAFDEKPIFSKHLSSVASPIIIEDDCENEQSENQEPTSDCTSIKDECIVDTPVSLAQQLTVDDVRTAMSQAIAEDSDLTDEGRSTLHQFIDNLITNHNLQAVFLLFKFLYRRVEKVDTFRWRSIYNSLLQYCQQSVFNMYRSRLRCDMFT